MKWPAVLWGILLLAIFLPAGAARSSSLTALHSKGSPTSGAILAIPSETAGSTSIKIHEIRISPAGRLGYQRMGISLKIPVPFELSLKGGQEYRGTQAQLRLPEANLWIGEATVQAEVTPNLGFYVSGAGNVLQSLVGQRLGGVIIPNRKSEWREDHLDWWEMEAGASFVPQPPFMLLAGIRWDHFDLAFLDARQLVSVTTGPYRNIHLVTSDVLSDLWIPYCGVGLRGKNYRAYVIASPFASVSMKVATIMNADILPSNQFSGEGMIILHRPGNFIEARLEYDARLWSGTRLGFWAKGSWLGSNGMARMESQYTTSALDLNVRPFTGQDVVFYRYNMAGGLSLSLAF